MEKRLYADAMFEGVPLGEWWLKKTTDWRIEYHWVVLIGPRKGVQISQG
jgi:hypothetical protein